MYFPPEIPPDLSDASLPAALSAFCDAEVGTSPLLLKPAAKNASNGFWVVVASVVAAWPAVFAASVVAAWPAVFAASSGCCPDSFPAPKIKVFMLPKILFSASLSPTLAFPNKAPLRSPNVSDDEEAN